MTEHTASGSTPSAFTTFDPAVMDTFVESNRTVMKNFERLSRHFFESAAQNFETAVTTSQRLAAVRTLPELAELQAQLSKEFIDTMTQRNKTASDMGATMMRDATAQMDPSAGRDMPVDAPRRPPGAKIA